MGNKSPERMPDTGLRNQQAIEVARNDILCGVPANKHSFFDEFFDSDIHGNCSIKYDYFSKAGLNILHMYLANSKPVDLAVVKKLVTAGAQIT